MFPDNYYTLCSRSNIWDDAKNIWDDAKRERSFTSDSPSSSVSLDLMSCRYYDFIPNASSRYLYITLNSHNGKYNNIAICCVKEKSDGTYYAIESTVNSPFSYKINNFRTSVSKKFTIGLINTKVSGPQQLTFSATYQDS